MQTAHETSLSALSEHDWHILSNRWSRGADWCVSKLGSRWMIGETFGKSWPLFKTKRAAFDALSGLILAESAHRAMKRAA